MSADATGVEAMYDALKVITLDPLISAWLVKNDPKALTQAHEAILAYESDRDAEYDHCEDDGSGYCILHDSRIVTFSDEPPYDVCEDRARVLVDQDADRINADPELQAAFSELIEVEARFEANGGLGVDDAEHIDALRRKIYPDDGDGPFAGPADGEPTTDLRDVYVRPFET